MPKLKHNFLKGRMNKDLDERLVPNGEYRDALNIEISTSEDSNTGAVQNVKGNAKVTVLDYEGNDFMNTDISDNAISVGVCADEVEGKIYNLIHLASDLTASGDYPTGTRFIGVKSDVITEFTKDVNAETGSTFPIVVDAFESRHAPKGPQTSVGLINGTALDLLDWSNFNGNLSPKGVRPGMRLQLVSPNGVDAYGVNNEVFVTKINYNSDPNLVSVETTIPALNSVGAPILLTQAMIDAGYVYKFTSPRILNFLPGSTEQEVNVNNTPTSYTPNKNIITGLNLYNDILFFTDNRNEPKRIVLENFRKNNFIQTVFNQRIQLHSLYFSGIYLEEEHITVAKRPPKLAPKFKIFQNERNGGTSSIIGTPSNGQQQTFNLTTEDSIGSGQFVPLDSNFSAAIANNTFDILTAGSVEWEVGDYIDISGVTTGIGATILVNSTNVNGDPNIFNITVVDIDQGYLDIAEDATNPGVLLGFSLTNRDPELWFAQLASKKSLYETSFVFFSYRYKYQNDEISPLAPYSRAAFIPGFYEFYGKKGFNKGMENHIDKIILYDFVEQEARNTNDIKEVQIVFKSSSSENPIIARTIKVNEAEFNDRLNFLSKNSGVFEIKSEVFGRSIQTKQQLRINDNVPRKALAQEISSSRLLLGNYLEGFNIPVTIKTNHSFKALPPSDQTAVIFSDSVFNFKGTFSAIPEAQDPEDLSYGFGTFMLSSQQYLGILNSNRDHLGTTWGSSRLGIGSSFGGSGGFGDGTDNDHLSYPHDWPGGDPIGNPFFTDPYASNLPGTGLRVPDDSSTEYNYVNPAGVLQRFPINHIEQGSSFWSTATPIVGTGNQGHMGSVGQNAYIIPQTGYYEVSCNVPRFFVNCQFMRNGGVENVREAGVPYVRVLLTYLSPNNTRYVLDEYTDNDLKTGGGFYNTAFEFGDRGLYGNSSSAPGAQFQQGGKIFLEVFKMNFRFKENAGGLSPATHATVSMYMHIDKTTRKNHLGHTMTVNGPPSFQTITIPSTTPSKSVKSDTEYQIGVVYGDFYGRETPVLVDDKNRIEISKSNSTTKNLLITQVENEAPAFADYYKFYVKEVMSEYYNLVMHSAYPADLDEFFNSSAASGGATQVGFTTSTSEAWLAFNSADRSKIEIDDYLVQKKQHGTVVSVTDEEAKWRVLDIVDNAVGNQISTTTGANLSSSTSFEINGVDLLNAGFEDVNGKFFVKIKADDKFDEHIGGVGAAAAAVGTPNLVPGSNAAGNNGAVFEIRKKDIKDLDLFYEVSQAFPIKLTNKNAHHYINTTDVVKIFKDFNSNLDQEVCDAFNEALFIVEEVNGAKSFGYNQLNSVSSNDPTFGEGLVEIRIGATGPVSGNAAAGNPGISSVNLPTAGVPLSSTHVPIGSIISFENPDSGFVSGEVVDFGAADDKKIYIKPFSCLTSSSSKILPIGLNWWNVISFGNGVESDRIRDDFNADSVYKYTAVGKQSGFEASIQNEDYKEVRYENNIIFSQIFSAALGGGYNEFIAVEDIVKQVNTEYGSIQKLFTRDGDVVTFCENKVLRILSSGKDALFNAEGKAEIIKSTNVLGQAIPYLGDYGISNNPESFAAEEYRLYFADKNRGAICRLSRDGITPISDAGMRDFFNDHLANAQSIIGSYDGKKNEYNITIHEVINPNVKKNVFTLGYKENVKGWTSFKSFIKEQGISLQNNYYTFKNSLCYLHHPDTLAHTYCKFYSTTNNASITDIFSESSEVVKLYKTVSYEGTQSKVVKFTDEVVDGVTYNDNEYYNATAKKGWFVESITTDMQEGDIDEFIEKEGKWHNFIKGIETTFTNASDNNGVADGNIDFNEFSIQGIGNLTSNATVQSGTVPGTGFDVNITMSPCSSVPNLFSASNFYQANVIDNLNTFVNANAATVTITPSANYCIAAADFTADFPNVTLPSGVDSIIFSDTTTPYAFDNEVVATFNLQTNFTLSSDFTIDVPICVTPVLLPINYEAVINVNGDFYSTVPMTVSYNFGSGLTSPSIVPFGSTATSQSYLFTATIPQNYNGSLIDITVLNGSNVFTSDPTVAFTDVTSTTPNTISPEQQNYNFNTNHQPHLNSSVQIDYTPISTNQSTIDNNNTIEITTNFIGQFLQFVNSNFTTGLPTAMPGSIIIDTLGGSFTYGVSTNAGNYTATIDSDPDNIINNLSFVQNTSNLSLSTPNTTTTPLGMVQIDVNPNTGSTALSATIKITSDNNPLLQDTLVINQPLGFELNATAAWSMSMLNTFNQLDGYYFGDTNLPVSGSNSSTLIQNAFQENLNVAPFIYPSQGNVTLAGGLGSSSTITILITHNADSAQSSTFLTLSDISFIDTGDGTNWVNVDNFSFNSVGNNGLPDGGFIDLNIDPNTTGTIRSLTVQIPHPHNSSFTDSIIITQAQGFVSGVNTVVFKEPTSTTAVDGVFVAAGTASGITDEIHFDNTAQVVDIFFKIPDADANALINVGLFGTDVSGLYNNTNQSYVFDQWNENDGIAPDFIPYADTISTINTGSWFASPPTVQYEQFVFPGPGGVSTDVNYKITIQLEENNASLGSSFAASWQNQFPVDRYCNIEVFNPHDNGIYPTGTLRLKQKAIKAVRFMQGNTQSGFGYSATFIQLGTYGYNSTHNYSTLIPAIRANGSTPQLELVYYDTQANAQNQNSSGAISASWFNLQQTPVLAALSIDFSYNIQVDNIEPNFGLSHRYCAISAYHSDLDISTTTVSPNTLDGTDIIIFEQPNIVPIIAFDPTYTSNAIHNSVIADNGQSYTQTQEVTATFSATTFNGSGPFTFTMPINHNAQAPDTPTITFIEATNDFGSTQPTGNHPSFFTTTDLAACSISSTTSLMTIQVSELPTGSVFSFKLRVTHPNNPQFFAELTIIYS